MKNKILYITILLIPFTAISSYSQEVYQHISNEDIYAFLEEMANDHLIGANPIVRPWSRKYIAEKLSELKEQYDQLTPVQQKEVDFYLRDFNKELKPDKHFKKRFDIFYYKDSLFTFSANLILGMEYWHNANGGLHHRWNGAEAFAYIGKHWGFYANLRDNHDSRVIRSPQYLNQLPGANYKGDHDFSEMRGGVTYSWKWGSVGLLKDHFVWGDNLNGSNIFSGRTPSYAYLNLHLTPAKWFDFRYIHGWLMSMVVDSSRSYWYQDGDQMTYRRVYHPKYIAANLFTFIPVERLYLTFGNSIVYDYMRPYPAYLIPFVFFKSIDHTASAGIDNQNSQMFFGVSSRQVRHLHLSVTLFLDEIAISRMFHPDEHSNFYSLKIGGALADWPLKNTGLKAEYTRTNPLTYRHYIPTITFASNRYNLGNYLQDNAQEVYLAVNVRPVRGLFAQLSWNAAQKGPDYTDRGNHGRLGLPFMETVDWSSKALKLYVRYQVINDGYVTASYCHRRVSGNLAYTPPYWQGNTDTFSVGMNFGF